ncbi:MAG TPA: hypothetical protein VGH20_01490 [Myxococcales bacterium]
MGKARELQQVAVESLPRLFAVEGVAQAVSESVASVRRKLNDGRLPVVRFAGEGRGSRLFVRSRTSRFEPLSAAEAAHLAAATLTMKKAGVPAFLKVSTVARLLRVHPAYVREKLIAAGRLKAVQWAEGGAYFIPLESYLSFFANI